MIDSIIKQAALSLSLLPFLERVGGIVTPMKKKTTNGRVITVPVDFSPDPGGKIKDFVPNNKVVGIAYFELENETVQNTGGRLPQIRAEVVLAVWVNIERISPADIGAVQRSVINAMPSNVQGSTEAGFSAALISYVGRSSIAATFGRYGYDNEESKMFRYPFTGFGLKFSVTYVPNLCPVDIEVVENNNCFNPSNDCL